MKKNMFLLIAIYFFVVQSLIAGFLRDDSKFFILAAINLVLIILISRAYVYSNSTQIEDIPVESKKVVEKKVDTQKTKKRKSFGLLIIFLLSIIIALLSFKYLEFNTYLNIAIAAVIGFVLFVLLALIFRQKLKKIALYLIWRILLILALLGSLGALIYNEPTSIKIARDNAKTGISTTREKTKDIFSKQGDNNNLEDNNLEGVGEVLDVVVNTSDEVVLEDIEEPSLEELDTILSEIQNLEDEEIVIEEDIQEPSDDIELVDNIVLPADKNITMIEAIKHLMDSNNINLDTKQNLKFAILPYSSEDYPYFKTAYNKGLIGNSSNPDVLLSCDTYIVMKGLVEKWNIGSYSDIKITYRNKAVELDDLNGCKKGEIVLGENL